MSKKIIFIICLLSLFIPEIVLADFNQNYVISDLDLEDNNSMSLGRIQTFLESKSSYLSSFTTPVSDVIKTAANVIYDVAQRYIISPKFIITTLQKEQSLITDPDPSQDQLDWATGFGVCDSCSKTDPTIQKYKGFFNQLDNTGKRVRESYLSDLNSRGYTISGWGPGITKTTGDGYSVTPYNNATAVLYTYSPHVSSNLSFWNIWNRWFLKRYPDGSLLRVQGETGIWLIRNNKRNPFQSKAAFLFSYDYKKVIDVSKNDLEAYDYGTPIKFPDYSLLQAPSGGVYLLVNGAKRPIISKEVFKSIGFNPEELIPVTWSDLEAYPTGEKITMDSVYPTGILLQSKQSGGIYYVENGIKHSIFSKEILNSRFRRRKWTVAAQSEIDKYPSGEPVKFMDGELVTSPNSNGVYLISDGNRLPIPSKEIFDQMGFKWSNIIKTTDRALEIHPLGQRIDYIE